MVRMPIVWVHVNVMHTTEFDQSIIEAWSAYEVFRDLGFDSDSISFVHTSGDSHIMVVLFANTTKAFNYSAGYSKIPVAEFDRQWERFTTGLVSGELGEPDIVRAYSNSYAVQHVSELLATLKNAGIKSSLPLGLEDGRPN